MVAIKIKRIYLAYIARPIYLLLIYGLRLGEQRIYTMTCLKMIIGTMKKKKKGPNVFVGIGLERE